jgi:hypothetical protein
MTRNLENAPISAGGAGQIPDPNAINDMSLSEPYSAKKPTILLSLPEALAKFHWQMQLMTSFNLFPPLASIIFPATPEALPNFHGLLQLMLDLILLSTQVMPEALPNFHRHIQLMTKLGHWREQSGV